VRIINGRPTPASQVLPPLMPGYDQNYKGYAYDPDKAKALLAEAGLKDGFTTQIYTSNTDPQPRITQAIQQDLAAIGVKAEIKAVANPNVIAAGGTQGQAPMVWSGGLGWIADFPDPSDFYGPILGCGSAVAGGWNWSTRTSTPVARPPTPCPYRPRPRSATRPGRRSSPTSRPMTRPGFRCSTNAAWWPSPSAWAARTRSTSIRLASSITKQSM